MNADDGGFQYWQQQGQQEQEIALTTTPSITDHTEKEQRNDNVQESDTQIGQTAAWHRRA